MTTKIRIKCKGADVLALDEMVPFQGELKSLSEENYEKLSKEILKYGFSAPFFIWRNAGKHYLLDGHQRHRTIARLGEEGHEVPKLPVIWVEAKSMKEAKHKLLAITSQYGKMSDTSLTDYMKDAKLDFDEVMESFDFSDIDLDEMKKTLENDGMNPTDVSIFGTDTGKILDIPADLVQDIEAELEKRKPDPWQKVLDLLRSEK